MTDSLLLLHPSNDQFDASDDDVLLRTLHATDRQPDEQGGRTGSMTRRYATPLYRHPPPTLPTLLGVSFTTTHSCVTCTCNMYIARPMLQQLRPRPQPCPVLYVLPVTVSQKASEPPSSLSVACPCPPKINSTPSYGRQ